MFKGKNNHRQRAGRVLCNSLHAEMCALLRIMRSKDSRASFKNRNPPKYRNAVVYVVRPLGNGLLGNAKPCSNCAKYLYAHGVTKIKYTDVKIVDGKPISVLCEMRAC